MHSKAINGWTNGLDPTTKGSPTRAACGANNYFKMGIAHLAMTPFPKRARWSFFGRQKQHITESSSNSE